MENLSSEKNQQVPESIACDFGKILFVDVVAAGRGWTGRKSFQWKQ